MVNNNLLKHWRESMWTLQNHKGSFCVYKSIFCQEGYCSACEIYLHGYSPAKTTDHNFGLRDIIKLQESGIRESSC
jgi:hypothetical protein